MDYDTTGIEKKQDDSYETLITAQKINVTLGGKTILEDFSLTVCRKGRVALCGPSGIGKSTVLRVLAGLIDPNQGTLDRVGTVSMVFDDDRLYPCLSTLENICLGCDWGTIPRALRTNAARNWASIFHCDTFLKQKAGTLSAGQRKRTALARAMMKNPDLLLLDETFHALDEKLRYVLMDTLLQLQKQMGFAIVFATHDLREAEYMNARIVFLQNSDREKPIENTYVSADSVRKGDG